MGTGLDVFLVFVPDSCEILVLWGKTCDIYNIEKSFYFYTPCTKTFYLDIECLSKSGFCSISLTVYCSEW